MGLFFKKIPIEAYSFFWTYRFLAGHGWEWVGGFNGDPMVVISTKYLREFAFGNPFVDAFGGLFSGLGYFGRAADAHIL